MAQPEPEHEQRNEATHSMSNQALIWALLALLVSIGTMVFVSVVKSSTENPKTLAEAVNTGVCVSCALLDDQDPEVKPLIQALMTEVEEGDGKKCCVQTLDSLQVILKLVSATSSEIPSSRDQGNDLPQNGAVAHKKLHLPIRDEAAEGTSVMFPLTLTPEDDSGELTNNVIVTPHGIIILHTGLYRVFVSLTFNGSIDTLCDDKMAWNANVIRASPINRAQSGPILKLMGTFIKNSKEANNPKIAGGFFLLQSHDHLYVEMSMQGLTLFDDDFTYLDLVMMGSVVEEA